MANKKTYFPVAATVLIQRLRETNMWFPTPAIISFGLVAILTGHLFPGLNPRLGQPARMIKLDAPAESEGSIWLSVSVDSKTGDLLITTYDRKVMRFTPPLNHMDDFTSLVEYFQNEARSRVTSAALARALTTTEITAVIAVDQKAKFVHVRPIINALAIAGISDYAFETDLVRKEALEPATLH